MRVTATPARHGPEGGDRGPVSGFVLTVPGDFEDVVYFSGDTVWYDGVREVAERFRITVALLCLGAARVSAAGDWPLTLTAAEAVEVARAMPSALIVPLHYEGWEHFSESRDDVNRAFAAAGLTRQTVLAPGGKLIALRRA
jgi:L-ascorbate metabolism protein UlaG (beta-lactamase superfamily)